MGDIKLPPFPPWSGPVPQSWDVLTEQGRAERRRHRLGVLNDACPRCVGDPDDPSRDEFLRQLARPQPYADWGTPREGDWLTPERELATFVQGRLEVEDRHAYERWAGTAFAPVGDAYAHLTIVEDMSWPRALLWFDRDELLVVEAPSIDRYVHIECVLQHLWPPAFRYSRFSARLDHHLDAPFRPRHPAPPAEASVFTHLRPAVDTGSGDCPEPGADIAPRTGQALDDTSLHQ